MTYLSTTNRMTLEDTLYNLLRLLDSTDQDIAQYPDISIMSDADLEDALNLLVSAM